MVQLSRGPCTQIYLSRWLPEIPSTTHVKDRFSHWDQVFFLPMWFLYLRWKSRLKCRKISLDGKVAASPPSPPPLSAAGEIFSDIGALPNFGESWMVDGWDHLIPVKLPSCPEFRLPEHHTFITRLNCRIRKVLWASLDHTCKTKYLSLGIWSEAS